MGALLYKSGNSKRKVKEAHHEIVSWNSPMTLMMGIKLIPILQIQKLTLRVVKNFPSVRIHLGELTSTLTALCHSNTFYPLNS